MIQNHDVKQAFVGLSVAVSVLGLAGCASPAGEPGATGTTGGSVSGSTTGGGASGTSTSGGGASGGSTSGGSATGGSASGGSASGETSGGASGATNGGASGAGSGGAPPTVDVGVNIRGRITDRSAKGIAGCRVTLGLSETTTMTDGAFVLSGNTKVGSSDPAKNPVAAACRGYLTKPLPIHSFDEDLGTTSLTRPNILMLMADDMNNWTSLTNNWAKTPNLKAFAATGVSFQRAHVAAQECNPSRTSMLLGQRPGSTGMYWNSHFFRQHPNTKDAVTMPNFFEREGYDTVAAGKIYHENTNEPWTIQGPGGGITVPAAYRADPWHKHDFAAKGDAYNEEAFFFGPSDEPEEQTGDYKAGKFIADHVKGPHDKPFLAFFGSVKPHTPLIAPRKYFDLYPLDQVPLPPVIPNDLLDVGPIAALVANNFKHNIHETVVKYGVWQQAVQAYNACASFVDSNVGMVLRALDGSPNASNTIVIFVSDHGVHLGTKEHWWKMTLWNETTRIPFILRVPGVTQAGSVSPRPVNALDIYPTLLDLLNYPANKLLDGRSLAPLLRDPAAPWPYPAVTTAGYMNHSVASEKYRYSRYADGFEELYDEEADPNEFTNIAGDAKYAPVIADLKQWLPKVNLPDPLKP